MTNAFTVRIVKSRFFVSQENLMKAMANVYEGDETLTGEAVQDCFNPVSPPTPWTGVESLLKKLGFKTYESEDGSVWIQDFDEQVMTYYQFKILVNALVNLSKDEDESFIYLETDKSSGRKGNPFRIEGGKLLNPDAAFHGTLKFEDFRVGKTPFHPLAEQE